MNVTSFTGRHHYAASLALWVYSPLVSSHWCVRCCSERRRPGGHCSSWSHRKIRPLPGSHDAETFRGAPHLILRRWKTLSRARTHRLRVQPHTLLLRRRVGCPRVVTRLENTYPGTALEPHYQIKDYCAGMCSPVFPSQGTIHKKAFKGTSFDAEIRAVTTSVTYNTVV